MTNAVDEAYALWDEGDALPRGSRQRTQTLDAAARVAEAAEETHLCYDIRLDLVSDALASGDVQLAMVAFAYCLALTDERPEEFPEYAILWKYKWMLEWAPRFSSVPRTEIVGLIDDLDRRYQTHGVGRNAIAKLRANAGGFLGDADLAAEAYTRWKLTVRDYESDCLICDLDADVDFLFALGRDDDALAAARELFGSRQQCAEVPHVTYARCLPSLVEKRDAETAEAFHRRGYELLRPARAKLIAHVGHHLLYLAGSGQYGRGLRIARDSIGFAAAHPVEASRLWFLVGAELLLERIARDEKRLRFRVPAAFGGDDVARDHAPTDLLGTFGEQIDRIARGFDARNGNAGVSSDVARWRAFRDLPVLQVTVPTRVDD